MVIVPTVALPPTVPFTSQTMTVPAGTQKDAVNDCELPSATLAAAGETVFAMGHVTVMELDAEAAPAVAWIVTGFAGGRLAGAV
jgi:hypothetical protein